MPYSAFRISLIYLICSVLWIGFSDRILYTLEFPHSVIESISLVKGWFFVAITTLLLYFLIRGAFRAQARDHTLLNAVISSSPLSILVLDPEGRVKLWNKAAEQIYGYSAIETIDKPLVVVPPENWDEFIRNLQRGLSGESLSAVSLRRRRKDGSMVDILLYAAPLYDDGGRIIGVVSAADDITEFKRLQSEARDKERLQMALDKEVELRDLRARFMSMLSHEFRNPLAAIFSSIELLDHYGAKLEPDIKQQRYTDMRRQIHTVIEMLDEFLLMMRSEQVGLQYQPEQVEINTICQSVFRQCQLTSSRHLFRFTPLPQGCTLYADEKLLRHALDNLLTNAIKYSPQGGEIHLELRQEGEFLEILVHDQGIGIPESDLKLIFEPFRRAANVGAIPGSGLGMSITRQAVELHGGKVKVTSRLGVGSTFTLALPLPNPFKNHVQ